MRVRDYLVIMLLSFSLQGVSQELKWAPPATHYAKFSLTWLVSDKHFDSDGNHQDNIVEYGYYSFAVYGESKWSERFTTMFKFPINSVYSNLSPTIGNSSIATIGDIDLGGAYHIVKDSSFLLTGSVMLGIPVRKHKFTAIQAGDNEFNQLIKLDVEKKFGLGKAYGSLSLNTGYNNRSLGYSPEWHYGANASVAMANKDLKLSLSVDGIKALGSDLNAKYINPTSLFSNFKEYLRLTPEVNYNFNTQWGIVLSTSLHLSGRNFVTEPIFSIGITRRKTFQ